MKQIPGQLSTFDMSTEAKGKDTCDGCAVKFGSIACFRMRGYIWNPYERFAKDADGIPIRRAMEKRECKRTFGLTETLKQRKEMDSRYGECMQGKG